MTKKDRAKDNARLMDRVEIIIDGETAAPDDRTSRCARATDAVLDKISAGLAGRAK